MVSFHSMTLDSRAISPGGARGQNLKHLRNEVFNPYLDNHLSLYISFHTWNMVHSFHSMTSMPRSGTRCQNLEQLKSVVFNPYLDNQLSESIPTWTNGTLQG